MIGNRQLLSERAAQLSLQLQLHDFDSAHARSSNAQNLSIIDVPLPEPSHAGTLNVANAAYVIECLRIASTLCLSNTCQAVCTAPVHKGIINDAGIEFSGHTEFFAQQANVAKVVMMLTTGTMNVALVTTHLPLSEVPSAITSEEIEHTLKILHRHLIRFNGIEQPAIYIAGLNPHAGEDGHLGREEIDIINPAIEALKREGLNLTGCLPADTLFTPNYTEKADAFVAMYHDQGLPVVKHAGFHNAANITLGLPFIRTSVDHGTALNLAGTGRANVSSFLIALNSAINMTHAMMQRAAQPKQHSNQQGTS